MVGVYYYQSAMVLHIAVQEVLPCPSSVKRRAVATQQTAHAHLPQAREPSMSDASLVADSDDEHAVSMVMDGPARKRR